MLVDQLFKSKFALVPQDFRCVSIGVKDNRITNVSGHFDWPSAIDRSTREADLVVYEGHEPFTEVESPDDFTNILGKDRNDGDFGLDGDLGKARSGLP